MEIDSADGLVDSPLGQVVERVLDGVPLAPATVPTGFAELDEVLMRGLRPGQLTVFAGVPGVGTSTLALGLARAAAFGQDLRTLFLAPDSAQNEVWARLIAAETGIPVGVLRSGSLSGADSEKLRAHRSRLASSPLIVSADWEEDAHRVPIDRVVDDYAEGLRVAVVDATPPDDETVRRLMFLAQGLDVVLVLTATTTFAGVTALGGERSRLLDLRAPATLAEMADLVIEVHRDDLLTERSTRAGEADLRVLKHATAPPATSRRSRSKAGAAGSSTYATLSRSRDDRVDGLLQRAGLSR